MSTTLNSTLIAEALNKHTPETFSEVSQFEGIYASKRFEVEETTFYTFTVTEVIQDLDSGCYDHFKRGEDLTLADAIDLINKEI